MEKIGDRIKKMRLKNQYTLKQVGDFIGVTDSTISKYENNSVVITNEKIEKLAKLFMVSPSYLMGWSEIDVDRIDHCSIDDVSDEEFYLVEHNGKMIKFYIKELSDTEMEELEYTKKGVLAFNDKVSEKDITLLENILSEMYLKNKLGK